MTFIKFVSVRKQLLISAKMWVEKKLVQILNSMKMQGYCDVFSQTFLRQTSPDV